MKKATLINSDGGDVTCGNCNSILFCDESGDMPTVCPECRRTVKWEDWLEPRETAERNL
jgi:hypothetical protein